MKNKALRLKGKAIVKDNKNIVNKTFFITLIFMSILFIILNPIIKNIVDIVMKSMELNNGMYGAYNPVLSIISIGITLMTTTIFSDFILYSLALDLIQDVPFNKESIKSRVKSLDKYILSKFISFVIQFFWYIVFNIVRILISIIFVFGVFNLFISILNGNESTFFRGQIYFLIIVIAFLVFFTFSVNIIIFLETFTLPFIALDTQNNFKKKHILKIHKSIMKKNRLNTFKLIVGFIPQVFLLIFGVGVFYYSINVLNYTMGLIIFCIMTLIIIVLYPKIIITLALAYERMYNYSEQLNLE